MGAEPHVGVDVDHSGRQVAQVLLVERLIDGFDLQIHELNPPCAIPLTTKSQRRQDHKVLYITVSLRVLVSLW